ncbi:BlaI/MecI/CopY family transcriptional regulator [Paenibacillus alvei]|uniref:BlaI/MecI/CopY family transcriptional regulator n=1 Tax=Paenibacillus TaxID=44249 RepID=UPI000287D8F9|nr:MULTISPECIES: BlaI/MecI/CopY family transcriptional regulator [Paenibacillus]EJW15302.1 putative transcriptional regulator [Paenibacillus alvei DSM 29]MCY9544118.1 BlaI/MecI/CopY family transcriptional regulator [Paenibacillus alvei]MCY9702949.1 BlaI/MecI/CopY family transcriptional regulator [Paenibacillus alvei]MCY9733264.1 BlaI/MecI/CopY family transcriptional regulator [Paenibacillus alvei]MCY9754131.1 BlaI/MecI/CopY family transcriptional regulator [Paenibacillus alvei]
MKEIPRISEAEWEVMKVFWSATAKATANEVIEKLGENTDWKPATIKSLINRLLKKNALGYEQEGKTYQYYPLVSEEECVRAESNSFLQRLYGGSLKPMFVNFLKQEKLSTEEVEELKKILDEGQRRNE